MHPFLKKLEEAGIELVTLYPGGGMFTLPHDEAEEFLKDPDVYWAKEFNVTPELFRKWFAFSLVGHQRCSHINKQNKQCDRYVEVSAKPNNFQEKPLCKKHSSQS